MTSNELSEKRNLDEVAESVADDVITIGRTWLETGIGIGLAALGAVADALRVTGDALGRIGDHVEERDEDPSH